MSHEENSAPDSNSKIVITAIASAGFLLLFALILGVTYLPTHSDVVNPELTAKREAKLAETVSAGKEKLLGYSVVNPSTGIYRVPIDVAMELTVKELSQ